MPGLPGASGGSDSGSDSGGDSGGGVLGGLNRAGYGETGSSADRGPTVGQLMDSYDPALVSLLVPGMVLQ